MVYLEPAGVMRRRAQRRVRAAPGNEHVFFLRKSGELSGHPPCDVLLTPYVLDVFPDEALQSHFLPPLLRALVPNARWLFTDFVQPQRLDHRLLLRSMYLFFRLSTGLPARRLPDYEAVFGWAGFRSVRWQCFAGGLIEARLLERILPEK